MALGQGTKAGGAGSLAAGYYTVTEPEGIYGTALGFWTVASGQAATALGQSTSAHCGGGYACTAAGWNINNTESQSLAVSGNVHAKNVKLFGSDARLAGAVADADTAQMLAAVKKLRVVERAPSDNYCRHMGRDPVACGKDRAVGLLAQQVAGVIPGAVGSGASLTLVDAVNYTVMEAAADPRNHTPLPPNVLEEVDAVLGLDVHALLAQLVGSVQALSAKHEVLDAAVEKHRARFGTAPALAGVESGCPSLTCAGTSMKAGALASAIGGSTNATGQYSTAMGSQSQSSGFCATAMGGGSVASGLVATAMGAKTVASGSWSTATGDATTASGSSAFAMGHHTVANCGDPRTGGMCVAMGNSIETVKREALAVSGNVHAKNVKLFGSDARLARDVEAVDPAVLLANVNKLRVVSHAPSVNYCKHQHRDPAECATDRAVGLLAQEVGAVVPGAVGSGASLTLVDAAKADNSEKGLTRTRAPVLEKVDAVQGIDVHALLAQQVGAIQALTTQLKAVVKENALQAAQIAELKVELARLV